MRTLVVQRGLPPAFDNKFRDTDGYKVSHAHQRRGSCRNGHPASVVLVAKFTAGAWITAILVPGLMIAMTAVKSHYDGVAGELAIDRPMRIDSLNEPLIIIPLDRWSRMSEKALPFAMKLSDEVQAVHVDAEECSPRPLRASSALPCPLARG